MATRNRLDLNQLAKSIVDQATGEVEKKKNKRNQIGGVVGGLARMAGLSENQKKELSAKAIEARRMKMALATKEASAKVDQLNRVN
jgi:hypothetical protein